MHIKNVRVTNPKNVLVQIPIFISEVKWRLEKDDILEVYFSEDEGSITIRPTKIQTGSDPDSEGETVVRATD